MTHLTVQQLSSALDGALTGPSLELVARHLASCHECRDRQASLVKHDDALRRLLAQDPHDLFLDDLTRRCEALMGSIARGMPAPVMLTSVPLLHEEDPNAAVEPPPPPPRPELGRAGEVATEAGFGRIGVRPTASTQAPESDPVEAQRLLEALASGDSDDFTELTAQGFNERVQVDGPQFDLPAWIREHSSRARPVPERPREVPRLNVFFDQLDEQATGMTREAVQEVFLRDEPVAPLSFPEPAALERMSPEPADWHDSGSPAAPAALPWESASAEHPPLDPGPYLSPVTAAFDRDPREFVPGTPPSGRRRGIGSAILLALTTIAALILVLLAPRFSPHEPMPPAPAGSKAVPGTPPDPSISRNRHDPATTSGAMPAPGTDSAPSPAPGTAASGIPPLTPPEVPAVIVPASEHAPAAVTKTDPIAAAPTPQPRASELEPRAPKPVRHAVENVAPATPAAPAAPAATPVPANTNPHDASAWPLRRGTVVDADGHPVPGVIISVLATSFGVRTDTHGGFSLSAPPGAQVIELELPNGTVRQDTVLFVPSAPELKIRLPRQP